MFIEREKEAVLCDRISKLQSHQDQESRLCELGLRGADQHCSDV